MPNEETRRWEKYNANPTRERVGDCVVRAIAVLMGKNWDTIYIDLCVQGLLMGDMPTANHVWGSYLRAQGYKRAMLGDDCTVQQFAEENRSGKYILIAGDQRRAACGNYLDHDAGGGGRISQRIRGGVCRGHAWLLPDGGGRKHQYAGDHDHKRKSDRRARSMRR